MAWKLSLYERLDQYFKLSLAHFSHKKKDESWSHALQLMSLHTQFGKITTEEANSLKLKARGYYDKRLRRLETNKRWRIKKNSIAKQQPDEQTTVSNANSDEYKMDGSTGE